MNGIDDFKNIKINGAFGPVEMDYVDEATAKAKLSADFLTAGLPSGADYADCDGVSHYVARILQPDGRLLTMSRGITPIEAITRLYEIHARYLALEDMGLL